MASAPGLSNSHSAGMQPQRDGDPLYPPPQPVGVPDRLRTNQIEDSISEDDE